MMDSNIVTRIEKTDKNTTRVVIDDSENVKKIMRLIIGLQNSGKTILLLKNYYSQRDEHAERSTVPDAFLIDAMQPASEWFNDMRFISFLKTVDLKGRKLTNGVKGEFLVQFLYQHNMRVFIDNIHKVSATKLVVIKPVLETCEWIEMTTIDEGQIVISLRSYIASHDPERVHLKSKTVIPTFDVTPIIQACLAIIALFLGYVGNALLIASIAVAAFSWRKSKQT